MRVPAGVFRLVAEVRGSIPGPGMVLVVSGFSNSINNAIRKKDSQRLLSIFYGRQECLLSQGVLKEMSVICRFNRETLILVGDVTKCTYLACIPPHPRK